MSSVIVLLIFVIVALVLAVFFWFWRQAPIDQVPPHLDDKQLHRIEVQDRLRQTNYQVLTAIGLGATFLITLFQFAVSTQHWSAEFDSRLKQERLTQFVEAVKQISQGDGLDKTRPSSWTANLAGIRVLASLGAQQPEEYHAQAEAILSAYVKERTLHEVITPNSECSNDFRLLATANQPLRAAAERGRKDREEANPGVQAAMTALGESKFASFRRPLRGFCGTDRQKPALRLEHLFLDDLDLSNLDLSCSRLTNSHFRRVSLQNTDLSNADLRGIRLADFEVPGSPAMAGEPTYKPYETITVPPLDEQASGLKQQLKKLFKSMARTSSDGQKDMRKNREARTKSNDSKDEKSIDDNQSRITPDQKPNDILVKEWKLYRCWVSDLRFANLTSANLEGSSLGGVDFRKANLTGVNFCRADVSRANFRDAFGLDLKSLRDACAGGSGTGFDYAAQPIGLPSNFPTLHRCDNNYRCVNEKNPTRVFDGSSQKGADFNTANLSGVSFCGTDVSGAKFKNAVGLDLESLKEACVGTPGDKNAVQPEGLPGNFPKLPPCSQEPYVCKHQVVERELSPPSIEPIRLSHNIALALLLAVAWITFWLVGWYAKRHLEVTIGQQTVEFPSRFPERNLYTAAQLGNFVREHPSKSRFYAFPVLFPLDLIVMVLLGASMAIAGYYWFDRSLPIEWMSYAWVALIFPVLYVIADLVEDLILARILTCASNPASEGPVRLLKKATSAKFAFIFATIFQTIAALVFYGIVTSCNWPYFEKACVGRHLPDPRIVIGWPTDWSFLEKTISRDLTK
jgi:uncharacterized protein YjbI with pentapeptide repeats